MNAKIEDEIVRMGDVGVAIEMVDNAIEEKAADKAVRALMILSEIFNARYASLRVAYYGGKANG